MGKKGAKIEYFEITAEGAFKLISMLSDEEIEKLADMLISNDDEETMIPLSTTLVS